jgi:hypothetical protein
MGSQPDIFGTAQIQDSNLTASGCHLARAVDEKLRHRRQRAVLQCDDPNLATIRREVDW